MADDLTYSPHDAFQGFSSSNSHKLAATQIINGPLIHVSGGTTRSTSASDVAGLAKGGGIDPVITLTVNCILVLLIRQM